MKHIVKSVLCFSLCLFLGVAFAQAQQAKKQVKKDAKLEKADKERTVSYQQINQAQKENGNLSKKKVKKGKPGMQGAESIKAMKNNRPVITYQRTGDPKKDRAAYLAAKKKWIAENPDLYKKIISKKDKE